MMGNDFEQLWRAVLAGHTHVDYSVHGPDHWRRVERNGLLLATRSGADIEIVRLFALFHDSRRVNDGWDEGHGSRGAEYAASLHYACTWHTEGHHHEDPTIGTCWDADRLDLGRVGIIPSSEFMSTALGREIADHGFIGPFLEAAGLANHR